MQCISALHLQKDTRKHSFKMGNSTSEPSVGDMIEIARDFYFHFGVYVGDGYIIHLTGDVFKKIVGRHKPEVKKELLKDVLDGSRFKVNNTRDRELGPDSPQTICDRAHKYIGYSEYDLKDFNCETFASMCRYGRGRSKQADLVFGKYNVKSVRDADL